MYFAKPDALQGSLIDTMLWCRPSAFGGVPRIWEKLEDKLKDGISKKTGLAKGIVEWA